MFQILFINVSCEVIHTETLFLTVWKISVSFSISEFVNCFAKTRSEVYHGKRNVHDDLFFRLYVKYRLTHGVETQFKAFMKGFNELVPQHLIKMFDERELEVRLFLSASLYYYQGQKPINFNDLFMRSMQKVNSMIHKRSSLEYISLM